MSRHLSQSTVSNPIDYNRKVVSLTIENMAEMIVAIVMAPENFAVADINRLKVAADSFARNLETIHQASVKTSQIKEIQELLNPIN